VHHTHHDDLDDPERWAITWRAYRRKYFGESPAGRAAQRLESTAATASESAA
jgi:glycine dehydrogenase subunit 2